VAARKVLATPGASRRIRAWLRNQLLAKARGLGIAHLVDFPGFVDNPYAWMSRAALFAMSSRWEG
jgi:glycosyltransferase involved in cell wall biosynthesis